MSFEAAKEPAAPPVQSAPSANLLSVAACTDVGHKRQNNEDSYLILDSSRRILSQPAAEGRFSLNESGALLAVADGMGGHNYGEVASRLCLERLGEEFQRAVSPEPEFRQAAVLFKHAIEGVSHSLYELAREQPAYAGMGTTLTAVLLRGDQACVAQVGDSRAYLLRGQTLRLLTLDQTVGNFVDAEQGAHLEGHIKDMLTQAVGSQPEIEVVLTEIVTEPGDLLLMCCDGLYKPVPDEEMMPLLLSPDSLTTRATKLLQLALNHGGPDNITLILSQIRTAAEL
ncbi:MAG TPA: protein phosphatase 2C domain-containing protein [Terriglobia bacterium]|nr:protein phosphatase 2C domain-containing protein [Terriglobia bacterium]